MISRRGFLKGLATAAVGLALPVKTLAGLLKEEKSVNAVLGFNSGNWLVGYKHSDLAGYVWAPYVPMYTTPCLGKIAGVTKFDYALSQDEIKAFWRKQRVRF